jgi:hypothetical protein
MITELTKDEVIETGARHRASYLLEQYGYTSGLAKMDGDDLIALMEKRMLEDVAAAADAVTAAYQEKLVAAEESKGSTQAQNAALGKAKLWRKAVVTRCVSAKRGGKKIPAALLRIEKGQTVPEAVERVDAMVKLLEMCKDSLHGEGVDKLLEKGIVLSRELKSADAVQELARTKGFSDKMREFYFQKGLLFLGLKRINDAGHELHLDDSAASARYNLLILYRNTKKKKKPDEPK